MVAGKKEPEEKNTDTSGSERSLRYDAEEQLARFPVRSPDITEQTPEELIHELQVHQIELETQAEELRRSRLALEESRDKYLDLYDFAPLGYLMLSNEAMIVEVNLTGATLLKVERSRLVDARFRKFIAPQDFDRWDRHFLNVLDQGEKKSCTIMVKRGDDSTFPARLESIRTPGRENKKSTVRVAISDITYIRKAEEALRISNKKLTLLSGITRHDIMNELMVLSGSLELAVKTVKGQEGIAHITRAQKAADIIRRQIAFTKEYELIGVNVPVWQDCRKVVDAAVKQALPGKVLVKNDLPAGTEMFADPLVIKVFYNLMDNAVRYGGKITTIRFSLLERGGSHVVVCEDDGNGVPADEKERIFKRGYGTNTGLGLALAREILDITGITISETGEPGKGARFEMIVPAGTWRLAGKGG